MHPTKAAAQQQFGRNAAAYVQSVVHATGASLDCLVALAATDPSHRVLDVATGGGHTALAFAPYAGQVVATDITAKIVAAARRVAILQEKAQIQFALADAEALPFADASFHRVVCRLALHHFPDAPRAISEMARVCQASGRILLADNTVPDDAAVATWINGFEKHRDPSHHWAYSVLQLSAMCAASGLQVVVAETLRKPMDFDAWTVRGGLDEKANAILWERLLPATLAVLAFLDPQVTDGGRTFALTEVVIAALKP